MRYSLPLLDECSADLEDVRLLFANRQIMYEVSSAYKLLIWARILEDIARVDAAVCEVVIRHE